MHYLTIIGLLMIFFGSILSIYGQSLNQKERLNDVKHEVLASTHFLGRFEESEEAFQQAGE